MHSLFNQRLANIDQSHDASYFENLQTLIQCNDGTRSFILRTVDCHDQSAPFSESQETRIQITHDDQRKKYHFSIFFVKFPLKKMDERSFGRRLIRRTKKDITIQAPALHIPHLMA